MEDKQRLFLRVDGHQQMGLGHVFRCLALVELLDGLVEACFFVRTPSAYLRQVITAKAKLVVLPELPSAVVEATIFAQRYLSGREIVVLDGYHFTTAYQQIIKDNSATLVCLDDLHHCRFVADVVINHAGSAQTKAYERAPYTKLYLGLKYALLQPTFMAAAQQYPCSCL